MYNLVHVFIGLLKELDLITEEAAAALSREMSTKILPSNPEDSMRMVTEAVDKVKDKLDTELKLEPWLAEIHSLESQVKSLSAKKSK